MIPLNKKSKEQTRSFKCQSVLFSLLALKRNILECNTRLSFKDEKIWEKYILMYMI